MYLKFINPHVSRAKKGTCISIDEANGNRLIKDKTCEEISEKEFKAFLKGESTEKPKKKKK